MDLEELARQFQRLDEKLDQAREVHTELLRQLVLKPARRRAARWALWPAIDVGFGACVLLLTGSFAGDCWPDFGLLIPAGAILVAAAALLGDGIWQLVLASRVDWGGPVAEMQVCLEKLQQARIRQFKWVILLSPLVGFCGLTVGIAWFSEFKFNMLLDGPRPWVVGNLVFGVLFIPLGLYATRILASRFRSQGWWQGVLDDISGRSLKATRQELERWDAMRREPTT